MSVGRKTLAIIMFAMFLIFLAILKFYTDQRLFWRTTLMSVRRKTLVVIMSAMFPIFLTILKFYTKQGLF